MSFINSIKIDNVEYSLQDEEARKSIENLDTNKANKNEIPTDYITANDMSTFYAEHKEELKGDTGLQGETGATPNIQVGEVITLEAGSEATVTLTGTNEEPVFNFGIPKGEAGSGSEIDAYTKEETEAKIDEKINAIPVNDLVHNLGHFSDEESLPSEGQPSGEIGSSPRTLTEDVTINTNSLTPNTSSTYQYVLGIKASDTEYCYIWTNYPEVIKSLCFCNSSSCFAIKIEATSDKPVVVYSMHYDGSTYQNKYYSCTSSTNYTERSSGKEVTEAVELQFVISGTKWIYGNLPNTIGFGNTYGNIYYKTSTSTGYSKYSNQSRDSLTLGFRDDAYTYVEGMQMLKFDENYQAYWVLSESEIKTNDMATVGEYNDIYVVNSNGKWERSNKLNEQEIVQIVLASLPNGDEVSY